MSNRLSVILDVLLLFCCSSALNIFNSMWLVAVLANSMHPAIALAPPLHPPRPHPASSMPCVLSQRWIEVCLASFWTSKAVCLLSHNQSTRRHRCCIRPNLVLIRPWPQHNNHNPTNLTLNLDFFCTNNALFATGNKFTYTANDVSC